MNVHSTKYLKQALCRPFLFFLFLLGFILDYSTIHAQPQVINNSSLADQHAYCGTTSDYLQSLATVPNSGGNNFTSVANFPSYAIEQCGKFQIYYEDRIIGNPQRGFNDPTYGQQRRNTFCAVLSYLQSIINFSGVSSSDPIRLYVDTSYSNLLPAPVGTGWYAQAGPYYNAANSGLTNGYLNQYVTTGVDPIGSGSYHAHIRFNFDNVYSQNYNGTYTAIPVNWYNLDTGQVGACQNDLYTTSLHEITHAMGWISLLHFANTSPYAPTMVNGQYSGIDNTIYYGTPGALSKLINSGTLATGANPNNNYWINNSNTPDNHPVFSGPTMQSFFFLPGSYGSHLDDQVGSYTICQHISPGDWQDYVMGPYGYRGVMRRRYTKIELQTLANALGYTLTPTAALLSGVNLTNHTPYSTRTRSFAQNQDATSNWIECVQHDFPVLQNNIGTSITYYFANDPTLIDPDGDAIFAYPGSIVNFRGCGNAAGSNGGNNHDQIQPITNAQGRIVGLIYTPRHNFMGRAQFGLNVWDGKEKGGFVYYTIDVTKGNNVTAPAFTEMVLNGGFEDGSEVKRIGADEAINNTSADMDFSREGHFNMGHHLGDSHPYDWYNLASQPFGTGLVIKNSTIPCGSGQTIRYPVGLSSNSCPGGTPWAAAPNIGFPLPGTNGGERYMQGQAVTGSFILMADSVRSCHYYTMEYDTYAPTPFTAASFGIGFVDSVVCGSASFANFFNQGYTPIVPVKSTIATTFDSVWTHHTVHFWWCGNPKGILYINTWGPPGYVGVLLDNISLKEDSTASALTASITQTILSSCQTVTLTGHAVDTACHVTYTWLHNGQVISNFQSVNVQVNPGGVYTLVVNDGCRTATDSINVSASSVTAAITSSGPCVPATLIASPTGAGYSYSWTGPGGFTSTANPITATQPGIYTVTVSNSSCSSSASYTANGGGNACCNAAIAATPGTMSFSNTTASAMLSQLSTVGYATNGVVTTNNYIVIDGTLTVNTPLTFASCPNIVFTSSATSPAQIVLNSGQTLNIKQSKLRAACGYMWQGITASDPGNSITISGSELHDMINGVTCTNGALLLTNNTRYEDNYTSIQLYDAPNNPNLNQPATYAGVIKSDTFTTSVNKLLAPFAGQNSHTGIFTRNSRGVTIGGNSFQSEGNVFSKLATGIYIDVKQPGAKLVNYVSTTNVYNNSFNEITGGAYGNQTGTPASQSLYNDPDGTAIYGKNVGTIPAGNVINVTNSANSTAQFTNCTKGITLTGMSANVTNTRCNNLTWGMNFGNASQAKYVVTNNNLQSVYYGVSVNGSPSTLSINRNKYNSPTTYFQTFNNAILLYPVGITLSAITNTSGAGALDSIYADTLNMNALSGIAINLQNTGAEVKALKNYISLNPPNSGNGSGNIPNNLELEGIAVSNALGSTIAGNHVTGNAWAITTSRTNVAAVAMTSSQQLRLNCNHMNNMRFGFLTVGNCTTDTFAVTSNDFGGQSNGMLFRHLGNVGTLGQIGTRTFDNSNTFTPPFASDANGNQMRVFTVSICSTGIQNFIFTNVNNLTSVQAGGNNAACRYNTQSNVAGYGFPNTCFYQGLQRIGKVTNIDGAILIARDQVDYAEFPEVAKWLAQSTLFDQLTSDTDARTNNPVLDSFYQEMQGHPIRDVSDLNHQLQDIMNALAQGDVDLYDQLLHDAENANGNIGNSDQMAANERQINNVYIKYSKQGLDSLNAGDSTVIASLALQCPLIGGSAVYKARMLYGLIAPVRGYDDIDICNSAGAYKGGKHLFDDENALLNGMQIADETVSGFKVYPNPANETVTVDYLCGGTFTLTDMLGRVIKTVTLGDHAGKITVDIHNLMPGVYTYTHIIDGKLLDFGKLVVTK